MTYNKPDTKLDECICVAEKVIPFDFCDAIVKDIETRPWQTHEWYSNFHRDRVSHKTKELDIQDATPELHKELTSNITQAARMYNDNYAYKHPSCIEKTGQIMTRFSHIRFNRYATGQTMRQHHDHIHSLFDGNEKGIPVLSFILNFNDDYEGADLYFWKDTMVKLGKGDICMFPSNFLFPHGVTEATKGTRYSAVCWGW
tara:strand:- start:54 stop:653 length:600 start_codon:yes stop_codon:yes gene_type:complete